MKLHSYTNRNTNGSVLLVSLATALVLGILLAGYLIYTQTQNISVARSQNWNTAIVVGEAGVEEALAHLNRNAPYFDPTLGTNNLASNGWTDLGNGQYACPRRYVGQNYYDATITLYGLTPVIDSSGYVYAPSPYACAPQTMFAAVGIVPTPSYEARAVRINTKIDALFTVAMAAILTIDFNGKNVTTDSFDSADPNYSDNGLYPTNINKTKATGDVCTDDTIINSLSVGNAKIKGQAKTGPGGTIAIGPNGSVGDRPWVEGGNTGIKPGWSANDMNVVFPPVTLPDGLNTAVAPTSGTIDGVYYDYVLYSGNYKLSSFSSTMYVAGNAKLYVTDSINMKGQDVIDIAPTGASLKLYMGGSSAAVGGNGVVNESGNAANFYYFGLPANTSLSFNGNASFTGAIYCPGADFSLGGGGNNTYDFVGASVSKTVKMNGHFRFHYDENLAKVGGYRGFIPIKWKEP